MLTTTQSAPFAALLASSTEAQRAALLNPSSIALGARLTPLLAAYEAAEVVANAAEEVVDAAFEAFLADRTEDNKAAWTAAQVGLDHLRAVKWSTFEVFNLELQHGY